MWTLVHLVKKTMPLRSSILDSKLNLGRVTAFADDEYDLYLKPIEISDGTAALMLKDASCLPGNTMLMWYEDYMAPMLVEGLTQLLQLRRQQKTTLTGLDAALRDLLAATKDSSKAN